MIARAAPYRRGLGNTQLGSLHPVAPRLPALLMAAGTPLPWLVAELAKILRQMVIAGETRLPAATRPTQ